MAPNASGSNRKRNRSLRFLKETQAASAGVIVGAGPLGSGGSKKIQSGNGHKFCEFHGVECLLEVVDQVTTEVMCTLWIVTILHSPTLSPPIELFSA